MAINLSDIKNYMKENKIDNNNDINIPFELIPSLGIFQIIKDKDKDNMKWTIKMIILKESIYKNGVFTITIEFPKDFPNEKPEVRIVNKIYHLNTNPNKGHISVAFLNCWKNNTSITELLVGIYLIFMVQNPKDVYSIEMAREYNENRNEFNKKAKEYVLKYANLVKMI